jgi:gliding motility-associated-like protein
MGFHCANGAVFVLGGGTSSNISAVTLNDTTAALTLSTFQPTNTMIAQDVVSHAIDENGKIFVIYAGGNMSNKMCLVNNTFNGNIWTVPSTFTVFSEQGNKSQYQWSGSLSYNGFNCLAVNYNYLFYYDGINLAAYDKATGALYASTTVSGVTLKRQGGIAVDDCNNIYIGGNGSVLCYSLSGTSFNALTSMSLAVSSSTAYVYDIKLDKQNKILYVAGSGFVGTYSPIYTMGCATASSSCFGAQQVDQIICAGKTITVNVPNASNLGNPTFSLDPGAMSNSTGTFVLTPSVTTHYTAYITGTNPGNVVVTHSTIAHVTVNPQPQTAPTSTQTTCTSTANAINLNLSFVPTGSTPVYTVSWSTLPTGITNNTQTAASGGIVPGVYSATVMTSNSCLSVADFTFNPLPEPAIFTRQPAANYMLNCSTPSITVNYLPATYNYTTYNGSSAPIYGNSAVFTSTNSPATWTVYAEHPVSLCTSAQTFVVTQNTVMPVAAISPSYQSITCSLTSITTVTATANPTVNIKHTWMSPLGGSLDDASATSVFLPGAPGTYTHCLENLINGCKTCENFTVFSNDGFPTFSVTSPQSFTLGCASRSVANISILNAQTTPTGGAVSYTLLGPPTSTNYVPGGVSTFTVNVPGTWTVITRDNVSLCDTKVQVTVTQNTFAPDITVNYPYSLLTCREPSVVLQAVTTATNVAYNWAFIGTPGNLAGSNFTVLSNSSAPTKTTVGNYTISITNNDNSCIAYSVVPIYQNLFPPIAVINGLSEITCVTTTIQLSNGSSTGIHPQFNPSQPIMGYLWSGPSPQLPLQASSSYIAYLPGTYTLVVRDENNGCFSETTKFIKDARDYPLVNKPAPKPFVLDCGAAAVTITPNLIITGKDYTYEWISPPGGPGQVTTAVLTTTTPGEYWITVTNKANGCASDGVMYVIGDTLRANITSDVSEGYAPLKVKFINESHSAVPGSSMTTLWTFGNGTTQTTTLSTISPEMVFTQPGTYTVVAYIRKGICLDSASKVITVEFPSSLEVPNIFTPNGDGVNDIFFLKATGLKDIHMVIFDRWGHKVYEISSSTGNVAWNGKNQKGADVAAGVYYYILQTKGADGVTNDLKGNITLER